MQIDINYLAVIGAAAASMVLGGLWYGPLFGKTWMGLSGMASAELEAAKRRGMAKLYLLTAVGSLVMAYVLAHSLIFASAYLNVTGPQAGLMAGFWSWLGFIAPVTLGTVLWENKPWRLWLLNNGYHLLSLLVMGAVVALWP